MKCKCSLDSWYKIIGLCDIDEFNSKIDNFKDKSWNKAVITKLLKISSDRPEVKHIKEANIKIKIISIKIVDVPKSDVQNYEGLKSNGKILLVKGQICTRIFYMDNKGSSRINTVNFKNYFSNNIVIEEDIVVKATRYEIYPCIENIYLNIIDECTISQNINLFLYARKIEDFIRITNKFIFTNFKNETIVNVGFDSSQKTLNVMNTQFKYSLGATREVFKFELIGSDGVTKETGTVSSNQVANDFTTSLNEKYFEFGDIIKLTFREGQYVSLTDYPMVGDTYKMLTRDNQSFKITEKGIIPNTLINTIILNDMNKEPVLIINFDKLTKNMLVQSTGKKANSAYRDQEYFKVTINGGVILRSAFIEGDDSGSIIASRLSGQPFQYGYTITLDYKEADKVVIKNFPKEGSPDYNPKGAQETYRITQDGLVKN